MLDELIVLYYVDENGKKTRCSKISKICKKNGATIPTPTPYIWEFRKYNDPYQAFNYFGETKTAEDALAYIWKAAIRIDLIIEGKLKIIVEQGDRSRFWEINK